MPWMETAPVEQRERFVADAQRGHLTRTELCRRYGISRKTGYDIELTRRLCKAGGERSSIYNVPALRNFALADPKDPNLPEFDGLAIISPSPSQRNEGSYPRFTIVHLVGEDCVDGSLDIGH